MPEREVSREIGQFLSVYTWVPTLTSTSCHQLEQDGANGCVGDQGEASHWWIVVVVSAGVGLSPPGLLCPRHATLE